MEKQTTVRSYVLHGTFLVSFVLIFFVGHGQNIAINTDGTAAEVGVMLHVKGGNLVTAPGLQNIFQITSFDASTAALKLRLGLYTNAAAASRYGLIDVWDATAAAYSTLAIQPLGGTVAIGFTNSGGHKLAVSGNVAIGAAASAFNDEGDNIHIWTSDIGGSWCYGVGGANPANIGIEENDNEQSIAFLGPVTAVQKLVFGRAGASGAGQIQYDHNTGYFGIMGGNTGVGTISPLGTLHVVGSIPNYIDRMTNTANEGAHFIFRRARGTTTAPLVVQNGDEIAKFLVSAYDGSAYIWTGGISAVVNGVVAAGSIPTDLIFGVSSTNIGNPITNEAMRVTYGKNVGIGTTTPAAKLEVDGTSGSTIKIVDGNEGANKVLTSNATGQGSWQSLSSIGGSCFNNWQLYITGATSGMLGAGAPTTFIVPANITLIKVIVYGGGAYGLNGGALGSQGNYGGGGGGYAEGTYVVTPFTVYQVTVGAGGINGVSVATASCFSTLAACAGTVLIQAAGGSGQTGGMGSGGYLNTTLGSGGGGSKSSGGTWAPNGSPGSNGGGSGGRGTASEGGGGGGGGVGGGLGGNGGNNGTTALANTGAGGGGGGGNLGTAGNGADGKVIVLW